MTISTSKETIWHFSCSYCKGWWSIASHDDWDPKKLYCCHCGKPCVSDESNNDVDFSTGFEYMMWETTKNKGT